MITRILGKKNKMCHSDKERSIKNMMEISEFFAGNRNWGEEIVDEDLCEYSKRIAETIEGFEFR